MVNRVGDFGLLIGILLIIYFFRSLDFSIIFSLVPYFIGTTFMFLNYELEILSLISFFLFIGSIGKSAQLGLHT
jgi:NADH:ubiquinone oxidoreductase subunit 5 (subunit L)/multisubunit Na+/H+ antiporter MnhA subunit